MTVILHDKQCDFVCNHYTLKKGKDFYYCPGCGDCFNAKKRLMEEEDEN